MAALYAQSKGVKGARVSDYLPRFGQDGPRERPIEQQIAIAERVAKAWAEA